MSREITHRDVMTATWRRERARWALVDPIGDTLATVWRTGRGWEAYVSGCALAGRAVPMITEGPWETAREARAAVQRALPHWEVRR